MDEKSGRLWKLFDKMRTSQPYVSLHLVIREATAQGIKLKLDQLRRIAMLTRDYEPSFPDFILNFIKEYLGGYKPSTILDPWANFGLDLIHIANSLKPTEAIGLTQNMEVLDTARLLDTGDLIDWRYGDPLTILGELTDRFDLVASCLPWGMKRSSEVLNSESGPLELRDEINNLLLLKSSTLLNRTGLGFFIVAPSFTITRHKRTVYENLHFFGLHIDAILSIPRGTFIPLTNIPTMLVLIRREHLDNIFVGELTSDFKSRNVLLKNLKERKEGKVPQLGVLTDLHSFKSLDHLLIQRRSATLANSAKLTRFPLSKIALRINFTKSDEKDAFEEKPNSVYLPLIGNSPAVSSRESLKIKPHNYGQIILDHGIAGASYVAQFYNSELGLIIRKGESVGFIPKISKARLETSSIYLPDLNTQTEVIRVQSFITDLETQLETFKHQLWNNPRKAREIHKAVKSLNHAENFDTWINSLPFPLASILWAYNAELDSQKKVNHLLHFFEALAEFLAIISLSAFSSKTEIYDRNKKAWLDQEPDRQENFLRATFGDWIILGERLAKQTRRLLSTKENKAMCLNLYGGPSDKFVKMITSKKLYAALHETRELRNNWIAHTGVASSKEWKKRHVFLESILSHVRKTIADNFAPVQLLAPENSEYSDGIHQYRAFSLMGTR